MLTWTLPPTAVRRPSQRNASIARKLRQIDRQADRRSQSVARGERKMGPFSDGAGNRRFLNRRYLG